MKYRSEARERAAARYRKKHAKSLAGKASAYSKLRYKTPRGRFLMYIKNSTKRTGAANYFKLTFDEFMTFWQEPCHYCGDEIKTIGLDRVNNDIGYIAENIVPCCRVCNRMKNDQGLVEFKDRCKRISKRLLQRLEEEFNKCL